MGRTFYCWPVTDRIVVLRREDPHTFLADVCSALADAVNEPHAWTSADEPLLASYAAAVRAYAGLLRPSITNEAQGRIVDHLLERLGQAQRGEFTVPVADVVDRLHAELVNSLSLV